MTIKEYITEKLSPFGNSDAIMADYEMQYGGDMDADVTEDNRDEAMRAIVPVVESLLLAPRQTNISEGGFSVSYNYDDLFKWYLWLCKKYGLKADEDIVEMSGLSVITDRSNVW